MNQAGVVPAANWPRPLAASEPVQPVQSFLSLLGQRADDKHPRQLPVAERPLFGGPDDLRDVALFLKLPQSSINRFEDWKFISSEDSQTAVDPLQELKFTWYRYGIRHDLGGTRPVAGWTAAHAAGL